MPLASSILPCVGKDVYEKEPLTSCHKYSERSKRFSEEGCDLCGDFSLLKHVFPFS